MRSIRALRRLALLATLLVSAGCDTRLVDPLASPSAEGAEPRRGGTIRMASFAVLRGLDPATMSDALGTMVAELLYAGVVDYDDQGNIVPDLATHYEVEDAGRTYRFHLRENVRFHDGAELTAADVKRSVERALSPSTPNGSASFYTSIDGFDAFASGAANELSGVRVEGRYVVTFRLREPDATFLRVLALHNLRPVCPSAGARYDDAFAPCGAGPFKLREWDRGRSVTLARHEGYFRPALPYLDTVVWTYGVTVLAQRLKFFKGELDVLRDFTQADLRAVQRDERWRGLGDYEFENAIGGEAMNTEMAPFDNVELRRAVAAAINRDEVQKIKPEFTRVQTQVLPPATPGYDGTFVGQRFDYVAALEHMRRAGFAFDPVTGKGGYPRVIDYVTYGQSLGEYSGQVLAQQLARIGIRIKLRVVSWGSYLALTHRRGKVAFGTAGWMQDYPDASSFFEPLFSSRAINGEESVNTAFYKDSEVDALLDRAHRELDAPTRARLYAAVNRKVCDDAPWAFVYAQRYYELRQPYVRNYGRKAVWRSDVREAWLDRPASFVASREQAFRDAIGLLGRLGAR